MKIFLTTANCRKMQANGPAIKGVCIPPAGGEVGGEGGPGTNCRAYTSVAIQVL